MRKLIVAAVLVLGAVGCGGDAPPPPAPRPEPPLTFDEWEKIADPEEKFNRHTLQRLPKDQFDRAKRAYPKKL